METNGTMIDLCHETIVNVKAHTWLRGRYILNGLLWHSCWLYITLQNAIMLIYM